jgi:putative tryptophan/tyrosine transport system substrate-binding protein
MRRREFIAGLGSAAIAWPTLAHAQRSAERMRRVGVLLLFDEDDPAVKRRLPALTQALADLGWIDGRNLRTYVRWAAGDVNQLQALVGDCEYASSCTQSSNLSGGSYA